MAGFAGLTLKYVVMFVIGGVLIWLAIAKDYEPNLLLPIGFGAILANIPFSAAVAPGGFLELLNRVGIMTELFPILIFIAIGAMCDFGPLLQQPRLMLFGAAAQLGVFATLVFAVVVGFPLKEAAAIGIIGAAVPALLAAFGGLDWITANLPLLLTGLGSLTTGGIASYVAVRRMRVDKLAKGAGLVVMLLAAAALTGCVAIRADSDATSAGVWAFAWGSDSAANLANVAVNGPQTNDCTGVSFDSAAGDQQTSQAIQSLISLGAVLAPYLAGSSAATARAGLASAPADSDSDPGKYTFAAATTSSLDPDPAGFSGSPGPAGEGVYGRPSCARCQAYRSAHPDAALIDIGSASNRADMWAALRLRGFAGQSVSLPVLVTASAFTQSAR